MVMIPKRKSEETKAPEQQQAAAHSEAKAVVGEQHAGPAASPQTAVAVQGSRSVGAVAGKLRKVVEEQYKDAFKVDWNTFRRLQAVQGSFVDVENNKAEIGKSIMFELLSYQDNYQISPGTDVDTDAQYVRYSDDGVTTTQGEPVAEYLAGLKEAGYSDARMSKRCTLAGILHSCDNAELNGVMAQIDLPPTSKNMFDRWQMQASLDVLRQLRDESTLSMLKLTARVQTKGKNSWTVVEFSYGS